MVLGVADELGEALDRQRRVDGDAGPRCGERRDRGEILDRIVGRRRHHRRLEDVGRAAGQQDGVAVGRGLRRGEDPDPGGAAGAVVDHDGAELPAHGFDQQAAVEVVHPARRRRHDEGDGARRIARLRARRQRRQRAAHGGSRRAGQHSAPLHVSSSLDSGASPAGHRLARCELARSSERIAILLGDQPNENFSSMGNRRCLPASWWLLDRPVKPGDDSFFIGLSHNDSRGAGHALFASRSNRRRASPD